MFVPSLPARTAPQPRSDRTFPARAACEAAAITTSDHDQFVHDFKGTLFHPSRAAPISASEIPDNVRDIQLMVPEITLKVLSWAAPRDLVLIEWEIMGAFRGAPTSWRGAGPIHAPQRSGHRRRRVLRHAPTLGRSGPVARQAISKIWRRTPSRAAGPVPTPICRSAS